MGHHIPRDTQRQKLKERDEFARRRRTSFKQYLRDLEEEALDEELDVDELDDEQDD